MSLGLLTLHLHFAGCSSLKEKRRRLKPLIHRLHREFNISVAEIDHQDLWQRASLGVALVASQAGQLRRVVHSLEKYFEYLDEVVYLRMAVSYLEDPS